MLSLRQITELGGELFGPKIDTEYLVPCLENNIILKENILISISQDPAIVRKRIENNRFTKAVISRFFLKEYEDRILQIVVPDVQDFLKRAAKMNLDNFTGKIIAVAGSVGKTTTKYWLNRLIGGKCLMTPRSFNWIVPICITLLQLDNTYDYFIAEVGIDDMGQMEEMASLLRPHYCLFTAIGLEHLEKLISLENILMEQSILILHTRELALVPHNMYQFLQRHQLESSIQYVDWEEIGKQNLKIKNDTWSIFNHEYRIINHITIQNQIMILVFLKLLNLPLPQELHNLPALCTRGNRIKTRDKTIYDFSYNCQPMALIRTLDNIREKSDLILGMLAELGDEESKILEEIFTRLEQHPHLANIYLYNFPHINNQRFKVWSGQYEELNEIVYIQGAKRNHCINIVCHLIEPNCTVSYKHL